MSGSSNNRNHGQVVGQEESCSHGYEVAVHSPDPPPAGLAINHLEEPEEELSANNRWSRCSTFSLTLTAFIFILAAVGVVVGVAWSAISPASSKTTINVNKQAVAVAVAGPFDDYVEFGDGYCLDKDGKEYPRVTFTDPSIYDVNSCADKCECARRVPGVKLRGFYHHFVYGVLCWCNVDWLDVNKAKDEKVIDELNKCPDATYSDDGGTYNGSGKIDGTNTNGDGECYKLMGKAGKSG